MQVSRLDSLVATGQPSAREFAIVAFHFNKNPSGPIHESRRRLCRLHGRADRGELIGGQRLLREQQAGAFVKIGAARAQDVGRPAEGLRHQVAHRDRRFRARSSARPSLPAARRAIFIMKIGSYKDRCER